MTHTEFNQVLERRITDLRETLSSKGNEYAVIDRLSNFKDAAAFLNCTPEQALWGFVTKHIIAAKDYTNNDSWDRRQIDEKLGDIIAYCVLLDALFTETENEI